MRKLPPFSVAIAFTLLMGNSASGVTIDFESLQHGQFVSSQFQAEYGLTISAINPTGPDAAIVFDTQESGTADPDLESPFTRGNRAPGNNLGNILIIAENIRDQNNDGLVDSPDDEGSRPAGSLLFEFNDRVNSFGFDLLDVEGPEEFGRDSGYVAAFFSDGNELARVGFGSFLDPDSPFFDPTVVFGNHSANNIDPITAERLQIDPFDRVEVNFGGSAGIDNIRFGRPTVIPPVIPPTFPVQQANGAIPEPTTLVLLVGGSGLLIARRTRHNGKA